MSDRIPANFLDLFAKPVLAHLATLMPDGSPQVTPVWVDYDGTHVLVNTAEGRRKDRNLIARPAVALSMVDPADQFRYLEVRGRVVERTRTGAVEHVDRLARRYLGVDRYPRHGQTPPRVLFKIAIEHVVAQGKIGEAG